jgi:hypothetical protein
VEIISQEGYYKVIINDANIERHDGEMIARATNEHGTAESRARLIVEQEEESRSAPTFIKDIEDQVRFIFFDQTNQPLDYRKKIEFLSSIKKYEFV